MTMYRFSDPFMCISNTPYDEYIEKVKNNKLYAGVLEYVGMFKHIHSDISDDVILSFIMIAKSACLLNEMGKDSILSTYMGMYCDNIIPTIIPGYNLYDFYANNIFHYAAFFGADEKLINDAYHKLTTQSQIHNPLSVENMINISNYSPIDIIYERGSLYPI